MQKRKSISIKRLDARLASYGEGARAGLALTKDTRGRRLSAYTAVATGAVLVAGATSAGAAVVTYTPGAPILMTAGLYIDIDDGSVSFSPISGRDVFFLKGATNIKFYSDDSTDIAFGYALSGKNFAKRFVQSSLISSAAFTGPIGRNIDKNSGSGGSWMINRRGFAGVWFRAESDSLMHYAWIDIELSGADLIFHGLGWENTPNTPIGAGHTTSLSATPEPGTLALLAMGAGGLAAWRRRRKNKAAAQDGAI